MAGYRLYFLDAAGRIEAREEFEAADDEAAQARAHLLYRTRRRQHGFELWQERRFVVKRD
jgi:hypothetical protein